MKKNRMMRVASALLVAVLLTTCAISGTFAKYVTKGSGTDSARVAKFGVIVTGEADTFKETYAKDNSGFTLDANTVVSTGGNVVAPGTSGEMVAFTISGTPEVAVNVAFEGTLELGDKWVYVDSNSNSSYYCPLEITVGDETFKGTTYASADEFETAVNNKIVTYTKDYAAGTDLSGIDADDVPAISWKWAFEGNDDVKDTYLGFLAAAGNAATISLSVTATVTQID